AKALKLLFKLCDLYLKVRSLRFRFLKLTSENCDLVSKYSDLLLLKINYIFFDSGISKRIYDATRDLLPVHIETVNQEADASYNPIIRQVCNKIVYVDSWQTVTLTKRLSIKSRKLRNQSQSKALILLSQRTSSASSARPKSDYASQSASSRSSRLDKFLSRFFARFTFFSVSVTEYPRLPSGFRPAPFRFPPRVEIILSFLIDTTLILYHSFNQARKNMANKRLSKEKQTLVLMALCEGMPIRAAARMFKVGKN